MLSSVISNRLKSDVEEAPHLYRQYSTLQYSTVHYSSTDCINFSQVH